jgi:hypothetical protein
MAGSKEVVLIKAMARSCPPSLLFADTSRLGVRRAWWLVERRRRDARSHASAVESCSLLQSRPSSLKAIGTIEASPIARESNAAETWMRLVSAHH